MSLHEHQPSVIRSPLRREPRAADRSAGGCSTFPEAPQFPSATGVVMAENKTKETDASVESYMAAIQDEARRKDCEALAKLMAKATKHPPKMWGSSIVGFGSYH
jgi:hypothetical protein